MLERIAYRGWKNAHKLSNGTVELIVLADVGPRIISYGFCGGENELHAVERDAGLSGGREFRLYGGHRLWVSPEVERTYFPDNAAVAVSGKDRIACFTAPGEDTPPGTHLQKEMEIQLEATGTHVEVRHRITNHDSRPTRLAPWAPTMMRAGGRAILPLSDRIAMDKDHYQPVGVFGIWSYTDFADPRWMLGTRFIQLRQLPVSTGRFSEQMGGIYNSLGWGAYYRNQHLFVKRAAVIEGALYPDFGCNFEVFTNSEFLELETLGPMVELNPEQSAQHIEHWWLFNNVVGGEGDDWVEAEIVPRVTQTG